jgi:probable F420-dependent oxidoreductase
MTDRPFRFGVSTSSAPDRAEWRQRARDYEAMGFDTLVVADHLGGLYAPMTALLAAADATERLRIGTFVLNNDFWSPLLLAREAVTLDLLSGGRLELGLGAGHAKEEYEAAGLRYDRPGDRVARLAETVPLLRRLLDGETVDCDGAHVTLHQAAVGVAAAQERIPLLVGGNGDDVLALAATEADIVGLVGFTSGTARRHTDLSHFTWAGLDERIAHVRRSAGARADASADALELNVLVQMVRVGDRRAVAEEVAGVFQQPAELILDSPFVMVGDTAAMVEHLERLRAAGVTYVVAFHERGAPDLAPAIEQLR